jgi:acyl carrier protein
MMYGSAAMPTIKNYILDEFLPGEEPNLLTATTPLVSSGILDSLATLKLVSFLEQTFSIRLMPHETDEEHLDTLEAICGLVESKR